MTQLEQILITLEEGPQGGLTASQIRERTRIASNVLSTLLWDAKRRGFIARVGGSRGAYHYGITQKGRTQLPGSHRDPLTKLADALQGEAGGEASAFPELMLLVNQLEEYKLLRRFGQFLMAQGNLLHPKMTPVDLERATLQFLGADPDAVERQRESLDSFLQLIKGDSAAR